MGSRISRQSALEHFGGRAVLYRDPAHCSCWPPRWSEGDLIRPDGCFVCRRGALRHAFHEWLQQSMDQKLRPVSVLRPGTLLSLYLKCRIVRWHPVMRLVAALAGICCWPTASITFGVQADTPPSTVLQAPIGCPRPVGNTAALPQHARLPQEISASTDRLPGTHLLRSLSLSRAGLFSDLRSQQALAYSSQRGASSLQLEKQHRNNARILHHCLGSAHVVSTIRKAIPTPQEPLHHRSLSR